MSKRAQFVTGAIIIGIVGVAWNVASMMTAPTSPVRGASALWAPDWIQISLTIVGWYVICWFNVIQQWNRRPVMFWGKYSMTCGPGLVFIEPLLYTTLADVPVMDVVETLQVPKLQTKDNVPVGVEALLTYRIDEDAVENAVVRVGNVRAATLQRAMSTISDIGGTTDLDHLLEQRAKFGEDVVNKLKERVADWGVTIVALELKSLKINDEKIEQAIAMKARAQKEAAAELARALMQVQITTALNEAASKMTAAGWRLKEIETLLELCRSGTNNTLLIPTNLIGTLDGITDLTKKLVGGLSDNSVQQNSGTPPVSRAA